MITYHWIISITSKSTALVRKINAVLCFICFFSYWRYVALEDPPKWICIAIQLYVWVVLIFSYLPFYTIVPFFADTNSDKIQGILMIAQSIFLIGYILYNFFFAVRFFMHIIRSLRSASDISSVTASHKKAVIYASKVMAHAILR